MFSHRGLFLTVIICASIVLADFFIQTGCCYEEQLPKTYPYVPYQTMMLKQLFVNRPDLFVGSPQPLEQPSTAPNNHNQYRSYKVSFGTEWQEKYETMFLLRWIEFWWPKIFGTKAPVKLKKDGEEP